MAECDLDRGVRCPSCIAEPPINTLFFIMEIIKQNNPLKRMEERVLSHDESHDESHVPMLRSSVRS